MRKNKDIMKKNMRNAFVRVSAKNIVKKDNEKLGVKAGDEVNYTKDDLLNILDDWLETKKFRYYMIEHDDEEDNIHYHIVIEFMNNSQCRFQTLKNRFPYGKIENCDSGVKNCVQYLVHMNDLNKKQYSWDEVETNSPAKLEDYKIPGKKNMDARLKRLLDDIILGNIKEYEVEKIDSDLYIKNKKTIENAFEYRAKSLLKNTTRTVDVFVLQGKSGVGKSTFCRAWSEKNNKTVRFSSGSKDPWQDYMGEQVFVYDDVEYKDININDMKKILDNHIQSSVSRRFKNRLFVGDTIFICTNSNILQWYKGYNESDREAIFRRINLVMEFKELSEDMVANYVVSKIVKKDDEFCLESIDDCKVHTFDLKPYIYNYNQDNIERFLDSLEEM